MNLFIDDYINNSIVMFIVMFSFMDNEQKLFWLLNIEDKEILNLVGKFIHDNML